MYYELTGENKYEECLRPFAKHIAIYCSRAEPRFLERKTLYWKVSSEVEFSFCEYYHINNSVLLFSNHIWEKAESISDMEDVFTIPVVIKKCGEQHRYIIAVPPRIKCLDAQGRILPENVGRYNLFRAADHSNDKIYLSEKLKNVLNAFQGLNIKGVE